MTRALLPALALLLVPLSPPASAQVQPAQVQAPPPSAFTTPTFRLDRRALRELPQLDVYVDGAKVVDGLAAPQVGPLTLRGPGEHTVAVVPAGQRPGQGRTLQARADTAYANAQVYVVFLSGAGGSGIVLSGEVPDPFYALTFTF